MSDNRVKIAQDAIMGLSVNALASLAAVAPPDETDSPGASFLRSVRDSTLEALEYALGDEGAELVTALDDVRDNSAHEIADLAVPIYTHNRMLTFVDLAAYEEDVSDYVNSSATDPLDMVKVAGYALYIVADRLVDALLTEVEEAAQEADEGEEG